ncbi:hypothetical protein AB0B45_40760 [Nonomuraea sp. NPDC049152]|uniref:hypothetical protein n=1 Tax=Nonomuraea sp. NPDC049152 TaxID=3154350 RepID=UPI003401FFF6
MIRLSALLLFVLVACGETSALNERQATERVEQLIRESVAVIRPQPSLELYRPSLNKNLCLGATDGGSEERVIITRTYYLRGLPKDRFVDVAQAVKAHWQEQGHVITQTRGLDTGEPEIAAQSRPDDFILSLSWTQGDVLGIGVTSTCVWPDVK